MYHLPQNFKGAKVRVNSSAGRRNRIFFKKKKKGRHKHTAIFCETEQGRQKSPGPPWVSAPYLFLAARGFRLIFFDLSLFFFGGSGFACMCLP